MNETNEWSILTSFSAVKLYSKYMGELRFGPTYLWLKNKPDNIFKNEFYGDWFYKVEKGVYLQKWNSNPEEGVHIKISNDLILYEPITNTAETIISNIPSFHWEIITNKNNDLVLVSDNGREKKQLIIEVPQ